MAYAVRHFFPGGTQEQYDAAIQAVHGGPGPENLPEGQLVHVAGPTEEGWTIFGVHDGRESWERFRDNVLMPKLGAGIEGAFEGPPDEKAFELHSFWTR
jgi:hypothetical protein